ncbi:hypothetical protein NGM37_36520, partial [Streptomyces sp. TRM76130]|nr:hypothetical protein [Streptomyces sp. TRM76130]
MSSDAHLAGPVRSHGWPRAISLMGRREGTARAKATPDASEAGQQFVDDATVSPVFPDADAESHHQGLDCPSRPSTATAWTPPVRHYLAHLLPEARETLRPTAG